MKQSHNTRGWAPDRTDPNWAERVEREAEQHAARSAAAVAKAERRLARAEAVLATAREFSETSRNTQRMWQVVEARRDELAELLGVMQQSPGGRQRHRPVPGQRVL